MAARSPVKERGRLLFPVAMATGRSFLIIFIFNVLGCWWKICQTLDVDWGDFTGSRGVMEGLRGPSRPHVPKYMLDLYANVAKQKETPLDVVRSYSNLNGVAYRGYDQLVNGREESIGSETRVHTLVFHVHPLPIHERLEKAELRLLALIRRHQRTFIGIERRVTISSCHLVDNGDKCRIIDSRLVYEKVSSWETFNVTSAVRNWLSTGSEQRLEVRIDCISTDNGDIEMDFPVEPFAESEPLLLVYSSDRKSKDGDTHALLRRSVDLEETEEETNMINELDPVANVPKNPSSAKIGGRRRHRNPCRRRSLYINFADINYDTWILAPTGYEAYECTGKCYFPLSDHLTPTKHAIMQTLLHTVFPKRASRACCVPTKLSPISVLYMENNESVTFKFHYEDMVVAECGCR